MCAIIGAVIRKPSANDFAMLKRVFLESKIRGLHATGISYVKDGKINTHKLPVPADQFPFSWSDYVNEDENLYLIGHCRYSTSDLEYNQPIANSNLSVVHNGVVTQELPENWKELYGYTCETKNDTELLLHTIEEDISPLQRWKDSSLSVCVLSANKTLKVFRNGKRPNYLTLIPNGVIITSTEDISKRAGIESPTMETPLNTYLTFDERLAMIVDEEKIEGSIDYQHYENISN
jgi:glutamine phosphoribosylpyrophosphate amidotransferase